MLKAEVVAVVVDAVGEDRVEAVAEALVGPTPRLGIAASPIGRMT